MNKKSIQRNIAIILFQTIVLTLFMTGCTNTMKFQTEEYMQEELNGTWICESIQSALVINGKDIKHYSYSDYSLKENATLNEDFTVNTSSQIKDREITSLEPKKGIFFVDLKYEYNILKDYIIVQNNNLGVQYIKESESTETPPEQFTDKIHKYGETAKFKKLSEGLPSSIDVQYDQYSYLGDKFILSGTAVIDDYYNYAFIGLEPLYYCIHITPQGSLYSNSWYIYAMRNEEKFESLFKELKKGPVHIETICGMFPWEEGQQNMASLEEYIMK